jgi:hypothetical protein
MQKHRANKELDSTPAANPMLRIATGAPASRCFIGWRGVTQETELRRRRAGSRQTRNDTSNRDDPVSTGCAKENYSGCKAARMSFQVQTL